MDGGKERRRSATARDSRQAVAKRNGSRGRGAPLSITRWIVLQPLRQGAADDASDTSHRGVFSEEGTAGGNLFKVQALSGDQGGHTWCKPGMQGRCVPHCGQVCPLPTTHNPAPQGPCHKGRCHVILHPVECARGPGVFVCRVEGWRIWVKRQEKNPIRT